MNNFRTTLASLLSATLLAGAVQADDIFQTTLELQEPTTAAGIDRIEFIWGTTSTRKHAGGNELSGLAVAIYAADTLVYTDIAISEWLLLPILSEESLTERTREDIFWDFDLKTMTLRQFRSILPKTLQGSSGEHYQIADGKTLLHDGQVHIRHFVDGKIKESKVGQLLRQETKVLKSFEPGKGENRVGEPEQVATQTVAAQNPEGTEPAATDPGVAAGQGGLVEFSANAWGMYVAELAAFGIPEDTEGLGVMVGGKQRPVFIESGVLRFFLGEEDLDAKVELGIWPNALLMDVVDAFPVSVEGEVGIATAEEAFEVDVAPEVSRYLVTGMQEDEVWLLDVSDPTRPRWLTEQAVLSSPGGIAVYFETGTTEVRRLFVQPPAEATQLILEE